MNGRSPINVSIEVSGLSPLDAHDLSVKLRGDHSRNLDYANGYKLRRGRKAGSGWFLLTQKDVAKLATMPNGVHTARFSDSRNTVTISRLWVTDTEAVIPSWDGSRVTDTTPVLVHLEDSRAMAHLTAINAVYRMRRLDGFTIENDMSDQAILDTIWADHLQGIFGLSLTYSSGFTATSDLEGFEFFGCTAYDALWQVLERAGLSFCVEADGTPRVYEPRDPADLSLSLGGSDERVLMDTRFPQVHRKIPAKVLVVVPNRDFQFPLSFATGHNTATERYVSNPFYGVEYDSTALESAVAGLTVPGTRGAVNASIVRLVASSGLVVNQAALDTAMQAAGREYLRGMLYDGQERHFRLAGVKVAEPGADWSEIQYYDQGEGLQTILTTSYQPRAAACQSRKLIDQPFSNWGMGRAVAQIAPNAGGNLIVTSGIAAGSLLTLADRQTIFVYNGMSEAVNAGNRVRFDWDYQVQAFVITAFAGSGGTRRRVFGFNDMAQPETSIEQAELRVATWDAADLIGSADTGGVLFIDDQDAFEFPPGLYLLDYYFSGHTDCNEDETPVGETFPLVNYLSAQLNLSTDEGANWSTFSSLGKSDSFLTAYMHGAGWWNSSSKRYLFEATGEDPFDRLRLTITNGLSDLNACDLLNIYHGHWYVQDVPQ